MKYFFRDKKDLFFSLLIVFGFFISTVSVAYGASLPWFGGRIVSNIDCSCSFGQQITITGYPATFSGTYLYVPGETQVKGKGNVISGKFILGKYSSGGECLLIGEPCYSIPITKGTMSVIGTN